MLSGVIGGQGNTVRGVTGHVTGQWIKGCCQRCLGHIVRFFNDQGYFVRCANDQAQPRFHGCKSSGRRCRQFLRPETQGQLGANGSRAADMQHGVNGQEYASRV
jgi:hypothetical protein